MIKKARLRNSLPGDFKAWSSIAGDIEHSACTTRGITGIQKKKTESKTRITEVRGEEKVSLA
jgi:hypothetical protein